MVMDVSEEVHNRWQIATDTFSRAQTFCNACTPSSLLLLSGHPAWRDVMPTVCAGAHHRQHPGTLEGLWGSERQSAVSMWLHVWSGGANMSSRHESRGDIRWTGTDQSCYQT